jgi:hypothetical protein
MTLLNTGLQLFALLVLLLSGHVITDQRSAAWSVSRSLDLLSTLHCSFVLDDDEWSTACSASADDE